MSNKTIEDILEDLTTKSYTRGVSDEKFGVQDGAEPVDGYAKAINEQLQQEKEGYLDEYLRFVYRISYFDRRHLQALAEAFRSKQIKEGEKK